MPVGQSLILRSQSASLPIRKGGRMRNCAFTLLARASLALTVSACGSTSPTPEATEAPTEVAEAATPTPIPAPPPRFDQEENSAYYYIAAVSEEDRKKGKAAGDVIGFHYLGKNAKGEHVLALLANDGSTLSKSYCAEPCKVIRQGNERVGFSSNSIIGAAFEDAIAGNLKIYGPGKGSDEAADPTVVSSVPKPFRGAWDEMIADGCQGREARFSIDATKFYNFEAEYDVTGVKVYSPTEIDIRTTYKDENASQQNAVWEFRLVENGRALTGRKSNETYYRRCPPASGLGKD